MIDTDKLKRARSFWFHYNKPASKAAGKPVMTVHYNKACHMTNEIICQVPTRTRLRNSQPHVVLAGKSADVKFYTSGTGSRVAVIN